MISYFIGWSKTPVIKAEHPKTNSELKVSIIISARNEEKNILTCLSALNKQKYSFDNFEIIVVDDHSQDRTGELVRQLKIPNLRMFQLAESQAGKKSAITEGIKNANGKLIVTTDADCKMGEKWLSAIVSFYEKEKPKMIVAPVLLEDEKTFSEIFQEQEMTTLTSCACASLYYNAPILCSGANLIYEKEIFYVVNGFEGVDKTATGDDIFLMLKVHERFPSGIKYLKSRDAIVFAHPEKKISSAFFQRKRWASKSFSYGNNYYVEGIAILVFFTNFFILISGILSVINIKFVLALTTSFSIKCLVDYMLLYSASSFFGKKTYSGWFLLSSIIYPFYVSIIGLISPFTNYSWKGRQS